jgi:hypothetical protein
MLRYLYTVQYTARESSGEVKPPSIPDDVAELVLPEDLQLVYVVSQTPELTLFIWEIFQDDSRDDENELDELADGLEDAPP